MHSAAGLGQPAGALLVSCLGRGRYLYGEEGVETAALAEVFGLLCSHCDAVSSSSSPLLLSSLPFFPSPGRIRCIAKTIQLWAAAHEGLDYSPAASAPHAPYAQAFAEIAPARGPSGDAEGEPGEGGVPTAGFFAGGEIGPVGYRSYTHSYTSSLAVFRPRYAAATAAAAAAAAR